MLYSGLFTRFQLITILFCSWRLFHKQENYTIVDLICDEQVLCNFSMKGYAISFIL